MLRSLYAEAEVSTSKTLPQTIVTSPETVEEHQSTLEIVSVGVIAATIEPLPIEEVTTVPQTIPVMEATVDESMQEAATQGILAYCHSRSQ